MSPPQFTIEQIDQEAMCMFNALIYKICLEDRRFYILMNRIHYIIESIKIDKSRLLEKKDIICRLCDTAIKLQGLDQPLSEHIMNLKKSLIEMFKIIFLVVFEPENFYVSDYKQYWKEFIFEQKLNNFSNLRI